MSETIAQADPFPLQPFRAIERIVTEADADRAVIEIGPFNKPLTYEQREAVAAFQREARAQKYRPETIDNEWIVRSRVVIRNRTPRQES